MQAAFLSMPQGLTRDKLRGHAAPQTRYSSRSIIIEKDVLEGSHRGLYRVRGGLLCVPSARN